MSNTREVFVTLHIKIKTTKTDDVIKEALTIGTKKGIDNYPWYIMSGDVEIEVKKIKSKALINQKKQ